MRQFKTNSLFRRGDDTHLNACVGPNGGPYDFFDYALGYFKASKALYEAAATGRIEVDLVVYPMVFGFRHAAELSLKHLATALPGAVGAAVSPRLTHRLRDNWEPIRRILERHPEFEPSTTVPPFEQTIADLEQFDPAGEVFRFPQARDGVLHLSDASLINLTVLCDGVAQTQDIVEFWHYANERLREERLSDSANR